MQQFENINNTLMCFIFSHKTGVLSLKINNYFTKYFVIIKINFYQQCHFNLLIIYYSLEYLIFDHNQ